MCFIVEELEDLRGRLLDWINIATVHAINLGKFHHDLTVLPHWKSWLIREIIPKTALIQVREIL